MARRRSHPRRSGPLISASRSTTRCSGARRLTSAIASSADRATMATPCAASDWRTMSRPAARLRDSFDHAFGVAAIPGDEHRPRIGIVLGLCHEIRGVPFRPSRAGDDDDFGWAGVEVDGAVGRDERLGCRHIAIARSDDLVDAWNRVGAVRQRGDRVRAADVKESRDAGLERRGHHDRFGPRTHGDDLRDAGDARRNRRHQQRGGQRKSSARHVAADSCQRLDALFDRDAGRDRHRERLRNLTRGDLGDVPGGLLNGPPDTRPARARPRRSSRAATLRSAAGRRRTSGRSGATRGHRPCGRDRRSSPRGGSNARSADPIPREDALESLSIVPASTILHPITERSCSADTRRSPARSPPSVSGSDHAPCVLR